ncbi:MULTISPECIES: hypothetical protein [unclassified Saccharibacter]|uniref:hypothetical protein n=1 Tax=unclassified Saccharibacter TaxID=2648722 RepID=UPI001325182D|nr:MULTISPECIES: hypothetical protein [unclassified Saccharibacter]MXV35954.1 hypothetical protein [Saccharibacter sp. EH611]MXV58392.1 hypothetical protein [Saccharibacter sp. EH70]MXV65900.1 hypothetical protein [Saccharibacter sp. EH60]MXV65943.1 hypothetical protein [Saccharibacter sp. EH60]
MSKTATALLSDGPTTERTLKPDYETVGMGKRKRRVKARTVQTLHESGDISGEAVTAANRWLEDYIFFKGAYADYLKDPLDRDYIPGNIHTFAVARGKAAARIAEVREALGLCSHVRLEMLLVEGMSFSAIGKKLWPAKERATQAKAARSQCSLLLEQLANFYVEKHKKEAREKRTCTCVTNVA